VPSVTGMLHRCAEGVRPGVGADSRHLAQRVWQRNRTACWAKVPGPDRGHAPGSTGLADGAPPREEDPSVSPLSARSASGFSTGNSPDPPWTTTPRALYQPIAECHVVAVESG